MVFLTPPPPPLPAFMSCCHLVPASFVSVHQLTQSLAGQGKHSPARWKICQIGDRKQCTQSQGNKVGYSASPPTGNSPQLCFLFLTVGRHRERSAHRALAFIIVLDSKACLWPFFHVETGSPISQEEVKETKRVFGGRLGANQRYRCCQQSLQSSHLHHRNCTTHFTSYQCVCVVIFYALHCTK